MKRKAEIQKAYDEAVNYMQDDNAFEQGNSIEMCAGFQHALLWVLGRSTYHVFQKKKGDNNIEDRI
tara:strand:+ start:18944 stop:19141 length:198 start_codon:yes stop_codon:yes gene_type:complete